MSASEHVVYILAAYGVTAVLLAAEVWTLVLRSRAQARLQDKPARKGAAP